MIQGQFVFTGSSVTIISPLLKPSRTRPVDRSIVRSPLLLVGGTSITAGCDVLLFEVTAFDPLLEALSAGGVVRTGVAAFVGCDGDKFSIVTWTDSVASTAGASSTLLISVEVAKGCA